MPRFSSSFPVSWSVAISFMVIVMASVIGAISPWPLVQGLGWAVAFIGVAVLLVALAHTIYSAVSENRVQLMSRTAREMIDSATSVDDREWSRFNGKGRM